MSSESLIQKSSTKTLVTTLTTFIKCLEYVKPYMCFLYALFHPIPNWIIWYYYHLHFTDKGTKGRVICLWCHSRQEKVRGFKPRSDSNMFFTLTQTYCLVTNLECFLLVDKAVRGGGVGVVVGHVKYGKCRDSVRKGSM